MGSNSTDLQNVSLPSDGAPTDSYTSRLDHHLVSHQPVPLYMGALPSHWDDVPTRVVINMCGLFPLGSANRRIVYTMPMMDVADEDLMPSRTAIESFVDTVHEYALYEPTYWHCHAGLNRSGLVVACYLHRYRGMRISHAIEHMRRVRSPLVLCNPLFERRLREWYGGADEQDFESVIAW
jgi:hypothetical protein